MAYKPQVGDRVFDMMTTAADSTDVSLEKGVEIEKSTESIHNALMAAGFAPGIGNIADITDATLYALEGELGNAAWSAAAAIPIIGQMVSGKRALKVAKEAGEEMVTLYRGVERWFPGKMVKEGKFVGGGNFHWGDRKFDSRTIFVSKNKDFAKRYSDESGRILEFSVPKSYFKKHSEQLIHKSEELYKEKRYLFEEGIPKEFLKKVHK